MTANGNCQANITGTTRRAPVMFTVRNNFDFRALTPVTIPVSDIYDVGAEHNGDDAQPVPAQMTDDNVVIVADVSARDQITYVPDTHTAHSHGMSLSVDDGVLRISSSEHGVQVELTLGLIEGDVELADRPPVGAAQWPQMHMRRQDDGTVCSELELAGQWQTYQIDVSVKCYHAGFVDVDTSITNTGDERKRTFLALVKKVKVNQSATDFASRFYGRVCDKLQFDERPEHLFQGLDWAMLRGDGWSVQMMNDQTFNWFKLTPDNQWHLECNGRMAAHRLVQSDADLCCVTSITGPRYDQTRYDTQGEYEHITPPKGRRLSYAMRLYLTDDQSAQQADQQFVLYEGYRKTAVERGQPVIDLGVRHTTFGVLYIPDRLAEDFVLWRTDTTVGKTNDLLTKPASRKLKDVIARDFRILSALGLVCRYHHLKARNDVELEMVRHILECARTYGVRMCLDVDYDPGAIAVIHQLNREFSDVIEFNEPMNEAIYADARTGEYCHGVNADYLRRAGEMLDEFHKSDTPVIITISKGMSAYLGVVKQAGLKFQCASSHDYFSGFRRGWRPVQDQLDKTHEVANYPISLGNYCARHDLQPMATESGWGGLTHLSDEDRVAVVKEIYGKQLWQRGLTHIYKCWFQDTFWKRHGRRHYELIAWDRTLRGEGRLLRDLQKQYGPPELPIRQIEVACNDGQIRANQPFELRFTVRNIGAMQVAVSSIKVEGPDEIDVSVNEADRFELRPGQSREFAGSLLLTAGAPPGFYHVFPVVRFEGVNGDQVICGWSVLRHRSYHPDMLDLEREPYQGVNYVGGVGLLGDIDLHEPTTIVVGEHASRKEAEWAYNLHNVLHSVLANDELTIRWESYRRDEPDMFDRNLIVIGNQEHSQLITEYAGTTTGPKVMLRQHNQRDDAKVLLLLGDSQDTYGWQEMELARHDVVETIDIVCADVLRRFVALSRYYLSPRIGVVEEFGGVGALDTDKTLN